VEILEELFGLEEGELDRTLAPQILIKDLPNSFVMVKSFPPSVEDSLVSFVISFMQEVISTLKDNCLLFIVLDNMSLADSASWNLFKEV
jgi:hypothetical protein